MARLIGTDKGQLVFDVIKHFRVLTASLTLWFAGVVLCQMCMVGIVAKPWISCGACLMLPASLHTIAFMTVSLLRKLLTSFDAWYLMINAVLAMAAFLPVVSYDERSAFIATNTLFMCCTVFVDAIHPHGRKYFKYGIVLGLAVQVFWVAASQTGLYVDLNDLQLHITYGPIDKTTSAALAASQRLLVVCTFLAEFLWVSCRRPDACILLRASLNMEKVVTGHIIDRFDEGGRRFAREAHAQSQS